MNAVLEIGSFSVTDAEGFAAAYREVRDAIATTPGCLSVRMTRGVESPLHFTLLVEWESLDAHLTTFRTSERFTRWRAAISPFFAAPPQVEHFVDL